MISRVGGPFPTAPHTRRRGASRGSGLPLGLDHARYLCPSEPVAMTPPHPPHATLLLGPPHTSEHQHGESARRTDHLARGHLSSADRAPRTEPVARNDPDSFGPPTRRKHRLRPCADPVQRERYRVGSALRSGKAGTLLDLVRGSPDGRSASRIPRSGVSPAPTARRTPGSSRARRCRPGCSGVRAPPGRWRSAPRGRAGWRCSRRSECCGRSASQQFPASSPRARSPSPLRVLPYGGLNFVPRLCVFSPAFSRTASASQ